MIIQTGDHMTVLEQYRPYYTEVWPPIIRWTRRHPSVSIYGFGGERNYYHGIIEQYQKQYDLIKAMHPECLVMPQQAIRGIDYAFLESDKKELTLEPFPHHAERLALYTRACDLFGHYSGGAFGYNYFKDPWQDMEERFKIYSKPLVIHEIFMGGAYLNPSNAAKYTGRIPPYLYTDLKDRLREVGLEDRWPVYWTNSCYLQRICRKYCTEKTRKGNELSGYEFLGMIDELAMGYYTSGILDEFAELKPGDTFEDIQRYMGENVLLIDYDRMAPGSINRSFWSGDLFEADMMVSLFGEKPIVNGTLSWELKASEKVLLNGRVDVPRFPNGQVGVIDRLRFVWPSVLQTTRMNLRLSLEGSGYSLNNDWDFWVFPKRKPPVITAAADEKVIDRLAGRYSLKPLNDTNVRFRIVSEITDETLSYLAEGGNVLMLGAAPFEEHTAYTSFRSGLAIRNPRNVGTVIAQHPIFSELPHEGWGDWQFYPVIEGATAVLFTDYLDTPFDPILEFISQPGHVRRQAAIFEKQVGKGRLLVSTCAYDPANPSCTVLMDGIMQYMQRGQRQPASYLSEDVIARMLTPLKSTDPRNAIVDGDFDFPERAVKFWIPYGVGYVIDAQEGHRKSGSMKLSTLPADLAGNPGARTGAGTMPLSFSDCPKKVKLSFWYRIKCLHNNGGGIKISAITKPLELGSAQNYRPTSVRTEFVAPANGDKWLFFERDLSASNGIVNVQLSFILEGQDCIAWIDEVSIGPEDKERQVPVDAAQQPKWHRNTVVLEYRNKEWINMGDGWVQQETIRINQEGITQIFVKKNKDDENPVAQEVRIDTTPPDVTLFTSPALEQEGGVYYGSPDTQFIFEARDNLSGIRRIEVSIDGSAFKEYQPFKLPVGLHELRCRAVDEAGNISEFIGGEVLTGGRTDKITVEIK